MLILFLLCVLGVWLYLSYVSVVKKQDDSFDKFERLASELKKRYELISDIIQLTQNAMPKEQSLIDHILALRNELIDLDTKQEFINRKIALDKEFENESEQLISTIQTNSQIASDSPIIEAINTYKEMSSAINTAKDNYNTSARIFRKATDVFPTSFMARLNEIKSLDYMK